MKTATDKVRAVNLRKSGATMERRPDGAFIIRPDEALESYPRVLTERLIYWARVAPDRALAAKRRAGGAWRYLTYSDALKKVRSLGQAFIDRGLSADRPIAILSDNDLEHLLLMFAGQHVGIPTASIAPAYSLISTDFAKLKHVMKILKPGMVFVSSGQKYRRALEAAVGPEIEIVFAEKPSPAASPLRSTISRALRRPMPWTLPTPPSNRMTSRNFFSPPAPRAYRKPSSIRTA